MNGCQPSAKPCNERELDLQRVSDFHAVLLGMAAHDLRQPLQVIQSTYVAPLFDGVGAENVEFARQKGLELRIRPTHAVVVSNAVILDGIVRNLVRNAIKYTDSGRVLLSCRRRGTDMRIDIYDTGIGISADQLPRAFEAFRRLDSTKSSGLGLGLFVVRRAVELLGHRIEVSSTVGRGSRFSVLAKGAAV